jgi:hypothetical protein
VDADLRRRVRLRTVTAGECRLWTGACTGAGYPLILHHGVQYQVARLVWAGRYGPIPPGHVVAHLRGIARCIRLRHLRLVARAERPQLTAQAGRSCAGERHWHHTVTWAQVHEIRIRTEPSTALAREFGISAAADRMIRQRRRWTRAAMSPNSARL